jgi:hypothetical protein
LGNAVLRAHLISEEPQEVKGLKITLKVNIKAGRISVKDNLSMTITKL